MLMKTSELAFCWKRIKPFYSLQINCLVYVPNKCYTIDLSFIIFYESALSHLVKSWLECAQLLQDR